MKYPNATQTNQLLERIGFQERQTVPHITNPGPIATTTTLTELDLFPSLFTLVLLLRLLPVRIASQRLDSISKTEGVRGAPSLTDFQLNDNQVL